MLVSIVLVIASMNGFVDDSEEVVNEGMFDVGKNKLELGSVEEKMLISAVVLEGKLVLTVDAKGLFSLPWNNLDPKTLLLL